MPLKTESPAPRADTSEPASAGTRQPARPSDARLSTAVFINITVLEGGSTYHSSCPCHWDILKTTVLGGSEKDNSVDSIQRKTRLDY